MQTLATAEHRAPLTATDRLDAMEGLRGYLAAWVVVCHVMWASGINSDVLSGLPLLLRAGELAVDLFIIVSGFVIFLALDAGKQNYAQFVTRRFFRLFPVFIVLFAIAIPLSMLASWNVAHATQYLTAARIAEDNTIMAGWWSHITWHMPLHLLMLHGLVPLTWMSEAPGAFLIPAWSISLEWQFYLIAPFAYALATSRQQWHKVALAGFCILLFVAARTVLPPVAFGAALPFHIEFFCMGGISFFIYKHRANIQRLPGIFVLACLVSALLMAGRGLSMHLIPVALWAVFLGVILEPAKSRAARLFLPLFNNPASQYLGRISYSVYLSHILIIDVVQYGLLRWFPHWSQPAHFSALMVSTAVATVGISAFLYRFVETPGIRWGRVLSRKLAPPKPATAVLDPASMPERAAFSAR